jgi:glutamate--cysteine ligase
VLPDPTHSELVNDVSQLEAWFLGGHGAQLGAGAGAGRRLIGIEHEKIAVVNRPEIPAGTPLPFEGDPSVTSLFQSLSEIDFEPVLEGETTIALERRSEQVTLEPGGQIEHSGPPMKSLAEVYDNHGRHLREVLERCDRLGIVLLGIGFRPLGTLDDVPWMPKRRYVRMREYLPTRGAQAHEMMKRTATVQANVDFDGEADCARKLRTAMGVTSLVTALFAASPLRDGRPAGMESVRAGVWLETDPDRCGLLPFVFDPSPEAPLFARYTQWALDVPLFFLYRAGQYLPAGGITFRRFLKEGLNGERATMGDWEIHLSTLFPEARLKRYLEVRGADCGPEPLVQALPALWYGLLYDREACDGAWDLVAGLQMSEREALRREVPWRGLASRVRGKSLRSLCTELLALAASGLARQGQSAALARLEPLNEIVRSGRTASAAILASFEQANGDVAAFVDAIRYR